MALQLTDAERAALRGLQRQHRDGPGYVKVTVVLLLDKGRSVPRIADDLGLDPATVYRYAAAYQTQGLTSCLAPETETGGGGRWPAPNSVDCARNSTSTCTPTAAPSATDSRPRAG